MDEAAALALIEQALEPGEALLWFEAAPSGPLIRGALFASAFVAAGLALIIFMTVQTFRRAGLVPRLVVSFVLALWTLGAITVGGKVMAVDSTVYAVTDARVLVVSRDPWFQASGYQFERLRNLQREGDRISFRNAERRRRIGVTLWELSDAESVEQLIRERLPPEP